MNDAIFHAKTFKNIWNGISKTGKILKKINALIEDIQCKCLVKGTASQNRLKYIKIYSRRIDDANCLVYSGDEQHNLRVISCKYHYE